MTRKPGSGTKPRFDHAEAERLIRTLDDQGGLWTPDRLAERYGVTVRSINRAVAKLRLPNHPSHL